MKVKTAELSGTQLDYSMAMAMGEMVTTHSPSQRRFDVREGIHCSSDGCTIGPRSSCHEVEEYSPSTDWSQCGPLIEEHDLRIVSAGTEGWQASTRVNSVGWNARYEDWFGETPQIAICRAVVASTLGDEVDIPDILAGV